MNIKGYLIWLLIFTVLLVYTWIRNKRCDNRLFLNRPFGGNLGMEVLWACMLFLGISISLLGMRIGEIFITIVAIAILFDHFVLRKRRLRKFKNKLINAKFRICTTCLYSLEGHQNIDRCPECGERFELEKAEIYWASVVAEVED